MTMNKNKAGISIRLFIADDHAIVRDGLRVLLESQNDIAVIGDAQDGRITVDHVLSLCPDVVIMDISMPELNGIEATRLIRKTCPDTQVIILSMHSTSEHIFNAFQAGASGYLLKECAGVEVINAVRTVHEGRRYLCKKIDESLINNYIKKYRGSKVKSPLESLTPREREVLQLVVEGKTSIEIAEILSLSPKSVETYRSRLMNKLNIKNIPGLVKFALQHGLTRP